MNFSKLFIDRPIGTSLIMAAILLIGALSFVQLPVAALPRVDFPTISVNASLPGGDPETMASTVATPLEVQLAQIPGLQQMISTSTLGQTQIALTFGLDRNIDAAGQDVAAAINAAAGYLPKAMPTPPTYRKTNPSDSPILIFGLSSDVLPIDQVDDFAETHFLQQISQIPGVGQVQIFGERKPAFRVQVDPSAIANQGLSLDDVRNVLSQISVDNPKGSFTGKFQASTIDSNDQIQTADDLRNVIVAYRNGAPVLVKDIGTAIADVEDHLQAGWVELKPGISLGVWRQPGANVIDTADAVKAMLPRLEAGMPPSIKVEINSDRTTTIRASVADVEFTLMITIALVIGVIFLFLRKFWATVIPGIAVPLSLVGTFAVMYLGGYSIDNLSLMALTIAVGFVVDDAIVMIENIVRHIERGDSAYEAAVKGAGEIGFTIISITFSLIAVFIPLLLMGGIIGRLFHEFAITVAVAVMISAFVSLTLTPTMCAQFLHHENERHGRLYNMMERFFDWLVTSYDRMLRVVLLNQRATLLSFFATMALSAVLFWFIPKGFFPQQDAGILFAQTQAAQDISYDEMVRKQEQAQVIVAKDPAIQNISGNINGNTGRIFIQLKPFSKRVGAQDVIDRLRPQLDQIPGFQVFLQARQDIQIGGRLARTQYQYTLQDQDIDELNHWSDVLLKKLSAIPGLQDVATDQQSNAPRVIVKVDRATASRLGVMPQQIDDTLYDAFGQRQVATIFTQLNQYHIILEVDPKWQESPDSLSRIYVKSITGANVPLSTFATLVPSTTALAISHQGQFPAVTLSFNLAPGVALGDAVSLIQKAQTEANMPITVVPTFQGTAQAFQDSLLTMPYLVAAAIIAVYIVLGLLYESYIHPLTILSTIPSAGVGAVLMLLMFGYPLDMMGLIGVIFLIGIVKKNAIMMIDFALEAERHQKLKPEEAIYKAALLRFRPIMMTTMSAFFGGLTLMLSSGAGSEFRRPLGFAIVGGLIVSQALTLFTTPVVYLYLDRFMRRFGRRRRIAPAGVASASAPAE